MAILKSITNTKTVKIKEGYPPLLCVNSVIRIRYPETDKSYYATVDTCFQNTFGGLSKHRFLAREPLVNASEAKILVAVKWLPHQL